MQRRREQKHQALTRSSSCAAALSDPAAFYVGLFPWPAADEPNSDRDFFHLSQFRLY